MTVSPLESFTVWRCTWLLTASRRLPAQQAACADFNLLWWPTYIGVPIKKALVEENNYSSAVAKRLRSRVGQFWPKVEYDIPPKRPFRYFSENLWLQPTGICCWASVQLSWDAFWIYLWSICKWNFSASLKEYQYSFCVHWYAWCYWLLNFYSAAWNAVAV